MPPDYPLSLLRDESAELLRLAAEHRGRALAAYSKESREYWLGREDAAREAVERIGREIVARMNHPQGRPAPGV